MARYVAFGRRKWKPTPVFVPGESQGQGSLVGCCLWGRTESDVTEATQQQQQQQCAQSSEHGIPQRREGFVVVIQSLSRVLLFATSWTAAHQASLSFAISQSLFKFMAIELVMLSNHLILYCPLLLSPSIFPSIRVFSSEQALHIRWPKFWSFSFSVNPSNEYSGSISFRIDWFDLFAVQGTLKNLLQQM